MNLRPLGLIARGVLATGGLTATMGASAVAFADSPTTASTAVLTLTDTSGTALYGNAIPWHLAIGNTGTAPSTALTVTEELPAGVTYVPGSTQPPALGDPVITSTPGGATTLVWTLPDGVAAGQSTAVDFSAQPATSPAPGAYPVGSAVTDAATATWRRTERRHSSLDTVVASSTATIEAATVAQSATPLAQPTATGTVVDTITATAGTGIPVAGLGLDLYLPPGVSLAACPTPPPTPPGAPVAPVTPCTQPTETATAQLGANADGTPIVPTTAGQTGYTDAHWTLADLTGGGSVTFQLPLAVTNPAIVGAVAPAIAALLSGAATVTTNQTQPISFTSLQTVGTIVAPPVAIAPPPLTWPGLPTAAKTVHTALAPVASTQTTSPATATTSVHTAAQSAGAAASPATTPSGWGPDPFQRVQSAATPTSTPTTGTTGPAASSPAAVTTAATLPTTGAPVTQSVEVGGILMGLGGILVSGSRRLRRPAVRR